MQATSASFLLTCALQFLWVIALLSKQVLPDAKREAAPEELFQKQVHRRDLQALAIIGAGEYGEVYLALQAMAARTPDGTDVTVTVPRAVKMLKGAATEKIKQEYIREAITMYSHDHYVFVCKLELELTR